ncbi:hypothetical protein KIV56_17035 [Cryobacterium breve]|uniref:Uncharacterized protein n=1 Tax=Cryobacterium breve TaxID=1259258 RepID=A0ABY7NGA0_9MICO|nr:hypothetical protein [Cryobacterium breve]WBM79851.1 hypothetical protein KIV56_17035 [Cryobacterium breve]
MDDLLPLFDDSDASPREERSKPMTSSQRAAIRESFAALGVADVRGQFSLVEELTGIRIMSVADLQEHDAQSLILRMAGKVSSLGRRNTGNTWDDRDEDTWIDKL